jgi:hypothetical protein
MYFYSRADEIAASVKFPEVGLPRWKEILCRTLALIRTWRVSGGPAPSEHCAKSPHTT